MIVPIRVGTQPKMICATFESGRGASWAALPRWSVGTINDHHPTPIVPIALRGHASCDAPPHKWHGLRIQ